MKNKIGFLRRKNPIFQESQDASISASFLYKHAMKGLSAN